MFPILLLTPLPLVLCDVHRNSIKVGADQRLATKAGEGAKQPQEDILGQIIDVIVVAGQSNKSTEDHLLMVSDDLLETGLAVQTIWHLAPLDLKSRLKFHCER